MTLDAFAEATITVIEEDGIADYLPTIVLIQTNEIRVIEGIPDTVDHRTAIQNVIRRSGYDNEEFLFGVLSSPKQITIGHYRPQQPSVFMSITKTRGGYSAKPLASCVWWKLP